MNRRAKLVLTLLGAVLASAAAAGPQKSLGDRFADAVDLGDLTAIKALVEAGHPADTPIDYGEKDVTPLLKAAGKGRRDIVKYLIEHGANVHFRSAEWGHTPLSEAAGRGYDDIVEILLNAGADPKVTDRSGYPPFAIAVFSGQLDVAELLLKSSDINGADDSGNTYLMAASTTGNTEAIRWLVSKGAKLDKVSQLEYGGNTALTSAARVGEANSVRTLLELGANPHLKMKDGSTALSKAQESKKAEVIELVREALAKTPAPQPKAGAAGKAAPTRKPSPKP